MKKGFTLVEILVSIAILSFIVAGIYTVLNMANKTYDEDMGLVDLQQQARQAMDGMTREIRQNSSSDIIITDGDGTVGNPGPVINFKIPNSSYCFRYSLNSNHQLVREILICSPESLLSQQALANNIDSLSFSRSGTGINTIVEISFNSEKTSSLGRTLCFPSPCEDPRRILREKVWLRN